MNIERSTRLALMRLPRPRTRSSARYVAGTLAAPGRGGASGNQVCTASASTRRIAPIVANAHRHPNAPPMALIAGTPAMAEKLKPTLNQPMARARRWARQRSPSAASVLVGATEFTRPATKRISTSVAKLGATEATSASNPLLASDSTIIGRRPKRSASKPANGELMAWGIAETTASTLAWPSGMRRSRPTSTSSGPIIVIDVMMPMTMAVVSASVPRLTSCSSPGALTGARLAAGAGVVDQQAQRATGRVVLEVVPAALETRRRREEGEHRRFVGGKVPVLAAIGLDDGADRVERDHVGSDLGAGQRLLLLHRLHRARRRHDVCVEHGAGHGHDDERDEDLDQAEAAIHRPDCTPASSSCRRRRASPLSSTDSRVT